MAPEHDVLSEIYEFCEGNGLSLTIDAIYELSDDESSHYGLTDSQHTQQCAQHQRGIARALYFFIIRCIVNITEWGITLSVNRRFLAADRRY